MTATLDQFLGFWPEELPPHISASQIVTFERCPEQWRIRYVDRVKSPPKGYLIWGSGDHQTFEEHFGRQIVTGKGMSVSECKDYFANQVDELSDQAGEVDWESSSRDDVKDRGVKLVEKYRTDVAPKVEPTVVEREVFVDLGADYPGIKGYVDIETPNGIVERKTSGRKASVPSNDWLMQARIYQLAIPKPVQWHLSVKTKEPAVYTPESEPGLTVSVDPLETARTMQYARATLAAIRSYFQTFGPEGPWPGARARKESACSWCGYRPCRWWK